MRPTPDFRKVLQPQLGRLRELEPAEAFAVEVSAALPAWFEVRRGAYNQEGA